MNNYFKLLIFGFSFTLVCFISSCNLDRNPISAFSDETVGNDSVAYTTKGEMQAQYLGMYQTVQNDQEKWILDMQVNTEVHADNAYAGTAGSELTSLSSNNQDASNYNLDRDWKYLLNDHIAAANRVIFNVNAVPDPALTTTERKQWMAEAKIYRAMIMFDAVRLWGSIPMSLVKMPDITSDNIEEVWPLLYPARDSTVAVYTQIIKDLTEALPDAPAVDVSNKFLFSQGVANAMLARVYAEKPMRDYAKVIQYCQAVKAEGFTLVPNYADLFSVDAAGTDATLRHSSESIFEIPYPQGSGNWVWMMFGKNHADANSSYGWAKWVTPSRDLIKAFNDEGDVIRRDQAVFWDAVPWQNYYPADKYAFMYKIRSSYNSVIKIRLADILLLEAEARVAQNDLSGAAALVNKVRARVSLAALPSSITSNQASMKLAVLKERRLELAFEGQRWFDLVRNDEVINVMNTLNSRDTGKEPITPFTANKLLFPVPQTVLEKNENIIQNPGY